MIYQAYALRIGNEVFIWFWDLSWWSADYLISALNARDESAINDADEQRRVDYSKFLSTEDIESLPDLLNSESWKNEIKPYEIKDPDLYI